MLCEARMTEYELIDTGDREVRISSPGRVVFPEAQFTKRDLVDYHLALAPQLLGGLRGRPTHLKRFPKGAGGEPFFQKRIPDSAPDWITTAEVTFPSGRRARVLTPDDSATLVWGVNLGVVDWNPWQVRLPELDRPDELRVDLDPTPEASFDDVRRVALICGEVLRDHGLTGYPKTSGSRGIHVYARIEVAHEFVTVRRAALALAREVERRAPELASSKWWKEERHGVFVDYNQNIRDRTVASPYSVRPVPDARVSTPLTWAEVADVEPGELRLETVAALVARRGDPWADIDAHRGSLAALLRLADVDEHERGLPDAPWPPHFAKQAGEPPRVAPSRARSRPE
jgi:bifunctional non-homologous end joining protein LigD